MRRASALISAFLLLAAIGGAPACSDDDAQEVGTPLDNALGYLPSDAPLALALSTDLDSTQHQAAGSILDRFPFGDQVKEALKARAVERLGEDFDADLRPLLGEDLVVGVAEPAGFDEEAEAFLTVLPVADSGAARALIERDPELREAGESSGAIVYERESGEAIALEGEVLVADDSREELDAALARRDGEDGLTAGAFEAALDDPPEDALVRLYGDAQSMLAAHPVSERLGTVPWIGALRTLGASATADGAGVHVDFALASDPETLEDADLPIATGAEAPTVAALAEQVGIGVRDPSQLARFAMRVTEALGSETPAPLDSDLGDRLGIDLERDVLGQLTGEASASVGLDGGFGLRSELSDPARFEETLDQVARRLPDVGAELGLGKVAVARPGGGQNLYALASPEGDRAVFGIVDGLFVLARDPAAASQLAALSPSVVPEASGSLALVADAQAIAPQLVERLAGGLGGIGAELFGGPLGTLHGSMVGDTRGLRGDLLLEIE